MSAFENLEQLKPYVITDGIVARAVNGERLTLAVVDLDANAVLPEHSHDNEQLGFIIKGSMILRNMLPDPSFAEAIQSIQRDHEAAGMGAYYPAERFRKRLYKPELIKQILATGNVELAFKATAGPP